MHLERDIIVHVFSLLLAFGAWFLLGKDILVCAFAGLEQGAMDGDGGVFDED